MKTKNSEIEKSFYYNYGKFVIEFEHLVLSMKICIFSIITLKGLSEPELLRVILADQTAMPIKTKLQTLVSMHFKENPERNKLLEKIFSHTESVIVRRNEIIHGIILNISEEKGFLFKDKADKKGLNPIEQEVDSEMFRKHTEKMVETKSLFEVLNSYLNQDGEIFEHFFSKEKIESLKLD